MAKNSQKNLFEHSKAKVDLYGKYLSKYLSVISRDGYTKQIHIFDLFCGEGIYDDGGKGSPIVALETVAEVETKHPSKMTPISLLLNDINATKIEKLERIVIEMGCPSSCKIRYSNLEYSQILDQVVKEIKGFKNEKAIAFIDPYGYKEISINGLKTLLETKKSEVLLFLPTHFMSRFANSAKEDSTNGKEPLHRFINEVFDNDAPTFKNGIEFISSLKDGFKTHLPNYFIDSFTLEREKGQFFAMYFFTSHIYGFEKMLEAKWDLDETQGRGFHFEKSGTLFSIRETNDWEGKVRSYITGGSISNGDLYNFTLQECYLPKHTNEVLKSWQNDGLLEVTDLDGKKARKGAFYINYDDFKALPEKVKFKLKG